MYRNWLIVSWSFGSLVKETNKCWMLTKNRVDAYFSSTPGSLDKSNFFICIKSPKYRQFLELKWFSSCFRSVLEDHLYKSLILSIDGVLWMWRIWFIHDFHHLVHRMIFPVNLFVYFQVTVILNKSKSIRFANYFCVRRIFVNRTNFKELVCVL